MKNESNKEVRIIDENYIKKYDSVQNRESENFQDIDLDSYEEQEQHRTLKNRIQSFFESLKRKILRDKSDKLPNTDFQTQQIQQEQQEFPPQLPNPNFQDSLDPQEQELSEMINKLLQDRQQQSAGQQQKDGKFQQDLQSLVNKQQSGKSVKEVDENYENHDSSQEQSEQVQDNKNLDVQPEQSQQSGDGQQQKEDGQSQSESIKEALNSLVDKKDSSQGDGQLDSSDEMGDPNLNEQTPITATFSDSDDLTKLNVDWTSEDAPRRKSERTSSYEQTKIEEELLKAFLKYLVKTNYYVKTYGLDKKNRKQIAKHFLLGLEHKIMTDTYSDVTEPLTFYIDMKGQCNQLEEYNDFFRRLLTKEEVVVYFGYEGKVVKYLKVKREGANLDFDRCDMCHYFQNSDILPDGSEVGEYFESKIFNEHIPLEEFIRSHRISRLVAFSDYDAATSIVRSSSLAKIYWFCTNYGGGDIYSSNYSLNDFRGEFIIANDISKIMEYFDHFGEPSYENKQRKLQLRR